MLGAGCERRATNVGLRRKVLIVVHDCSLEVATVDVLTLEGFIDLNKQVRPILVVDACKCRSARSRMGWRARLSAWKRLGLVAVVVELRHRSAEPCLRLGSRSVRHFGGRLAVSQAS